MKRPSGRGGRHGGGHGGRHEVEKVADKGHTKKKKRGMQADKKSNLGWLIGPKLFRPQAYPICVSSKLCGHFRSKKSQNVH